jgi:MFS family permease
MSGAYSGVAIFAAECSPPKLRGALVMQWQMWTAFGIMVGYVADLAFYYVPDSSGIIGLRWRLMMGSAMIPAVIVCLLVYFTPEVRTTCYNATDFHTPKHLYT